MSTAGQGDHWGITAHRKVGEAVQQLQSNTNTDYDHFHFAGCAWLLH